MLQRLVILPYLVYTAAEASNVVAFVLISDG